MEDTDKEISDYLNKLYIKNNNELLNNITYTNELCKQYNNQVFFSQCSIQNTNDRKPSFIFFKERRLYLSSNISLSHVKSPLLIEYLINPKLNESYFFIKDFQTGNYLSWGDKIDNDSYNIVWDNISKKKILRRILFLYIQDSLVVKMDDYIDITNMKNLYALTTSNNTNLNKTILKKYKLKDDNQKIEFK